MKVAELHMPCYVCLGHGTLSGYFLTWTSHTPPTQPPPDTLAAKRRWRDARWEDQPPAEETRPCSTCGGTGQVRDHEAEALAAETTIEGRNLAVYDPVTHQWWPGAKWRSNFFSVNSMIQLERGAGMGKSF